MTPGQGTAGWRTELTEVGDGCFAYIQAGGGLNVSNAGLLVGPDDAVAIDALYVQHMTRAFRRQIRRVTRQPLRRVVSTHHHADHTLGLAWLPDGINIIAHTNQRREMQRAGLDLAHYREVNPEFADELVDVPQRFATTVYEGELTLHLGDRPVQVIHPGYAHTKGDSLVYVPDAKVLYTGDVCFNRVTPATFDGNIGNWIRVARRILQMEIETVVPGHGPVGDRSAIEDLLGYFTHFRREARRRYRDGVPPERAARDIPLREYANWIKPDRVEQTVRKLYQEFRGDPARPLSLRAARGG